MSGALAQPAADLCSQTTAYLNHCRNMFKWSSNGTLPLVDAHHEISGHRLHNHSEPWRTDEMERKFRQAQEANDKADETDLGASRIDNDSVVIVADASARKKPYAVLVGETRSELDKLPAKSVYCVFTSIPYHGSRDYGRPAQIGWNRH